VNDGYETSLVRNRIYAVIEESATRSTDDLRVDGDLRVVDKTGEDYLYPAEWFIPIDVPAPVQQSVLRATG